MSETIDQGNVTEHSMVADNHFEVGKLYCERGDFDLAIGRLHEASKVYLGLNRIDRYLDCITLILRMHAERADFSEIYRIKESLQELVAQEHVELSSKTYYTLGICSVYEEQKEVAMDYFQKALAVALAHDQKRNLCHAIFGLATVYYKSDKLQEALQEIYNLQVFFQVIKLPDLKLSCSILNAHILRKQKRYDEALEIFWACYDQLRESKNMSTFLYLLLGLALTYQDSGDAQMARTYLQLAKHSVDERNMKVLAQQLDLKLKELGVRTMGDFDLVLSSASNTVTERKRGQVDFKNQFILLDLLRLFMRAPGQVYSKEALAQSIWKQDYNPPVHDNKIYVTIKRLRKMIEPDFDKPRYIFRAKNGYYLNRNTRVYVES
jgi:tetratricopeptide (TPR) repeat protein